jgi:nitrogen regulatory protein P-II 1
MKQILAIVHTDRVKATVEAIEAANVGGVSVVQVHGRGKGNRPILRGERGTSRHVAEYDTLNGIVVVVEDSLVEAVKSAILGTASTGSKGDGKIFVIPVEEAIDIGSKSTGDAAL